MWFQKSLSLMRFLCKVVETLTKTSVLSLGRQKSQDDRIKLLCLQSSDTVEGISDDISVEQEVSQTSEVLTFVDSSTGIIDNTKYVPSSIATDSISEGTSLKTFLSRPTLIDTRTWTTASTVGTLGSDIEPWYQFLNNSVIQNKIKNYAFLRAKLCMKIVINATPFHFGLLRVSYEPSVNIANTGFRRSKIRTNLVSSNPYVIPYSQLPGTWVYPANNAGGEIHVPFFKHGNWAVLTSASDIKSLGVLDYYIAAPLAVASSSGSTSVTISTFAWLEDVELSGSTAQLTLQAKDEYDGPVSAPASAVSNVSRLLENVPIIGKFARATTIGATAIANVASMFGFTNVPNISTVNAIVPTTTPHLASCEISTPIQKLSLDPKQELSLDPSLHGLTSEDEMCIKSIVQRESTLTLTSWSTADAVGTVVFNANPSPMLFGRVEILDGASARKAHRIYHTPMSYVGMLFQHWRGDIIFDFDVVCTKFHKGRLKVGWDPLGSGGTTALNENEVYTTIIDIGENNKASIRVPYHQEYEFSRMRGITRDNWSPGNALPSNATTDNGLLVVSVLTPLMSPVSPQSVYIRVSVRAAENMEFVNPAVANGETSIAAPPSFFAVQAKDEVDVVSKEVTLGDRGSKHPERYSLNFGERIVSLRSLLHRYSVCDYSVVAKQASTKYSLFSKSFSRLPAMFGYDTNGLSTFNKILAGVGTANFNACPTHPITYVSMMYGGMRGSVNFISNISSDLTPYIGEVTVQRINDNTLSSYRRGLYVTNVNTGVTVSNDLYNICNGYGVNAYGAAGAAFTNTQTNGCVSWNMPHMSQAIITYPDPTFSITGNSFDETTRECSLLTIKVNQTTANTNTDSLMVTTYAASGPDFTCLWWLCCPTLDYYETYPTAP